MTNGRPQPIGELLAQLIARRGYGRQQGAADCAAAWRQAAGETLGKYSRPGNIRRGALEVIVANSTLLQEMAFQKVGLLERIRQLLPDESIRDLRFKVGSIE